LPREVLDLSFLGTISHLDDAHIGAFFNLPFWQI